MSFFADIRCPHCGYKEQVMLGGYGFLTHENHKCRFCGKTFNAQNHSSNILPND